MFWTTSTLAVVAAWAFVGVVASVAMIGPLFFDEVCYTKGWENHSVRYIYHKASARSYVLGVGYVGGNVPCIGYFFWQVILGSFLLGYLLTARVFDPVDRVHIWTRRFLTVTSMTCILTSTRPWILAACPKSPWDASVWWAVVILCSSLTLAVSQACLMQIAVLRLVFVADPVVAKRARRLLTATVLCGLVVCICIALSQAIAAFKLIASISIAATCLLYVCFHIHGTVVFGLAARAAAHESRERGFHDAEASRALATAVMLFAAAGTMVYLLTVEALRDDTAFRRWFFELSAPMNGCSDVVLALLCAGLIGTWHTQPEKTLSDMGDLVRERRERQIRKRLVEAAKASTGPAAMLAALIESQDADQLMFEAIQRFRSISWDVLAQRPDIIINGGPLNVVGAAGSDVYKLSKPCQISDCDAFVSHSWHDNGSQKWEALKAWCESFRVVKGRWPQLWLDRVCIDQQNLDADLKCLPIFLAGCEQLLVLAGSTYTSRLWCALELFVYMQMIVEDGSREWPIIKTLGADGAERQQVRAAFLAFDVAACSCFDPKDKERMLKIFESYHGGLAEFNNQIRRRVPSLASVKTGSVVVGL